MKSKILLAKPEESNLFKLSVSKAKTFKDCKAKYRFTYIEKLPRKEWDFHVYGKFLHEIFERFYQKRLNGDTGADNIVLSASWREAIANWKEKLSSEQIKEAKETCVAFLKNLKTDTSRVIAVEDPFDIDIDGKVLLNGFIDRVQIDEDEMLHVSDYKTTKKVEYLEKDFFQLKTYAFVMCLRDPNLERVRTSYILLRHGLRLIPKEFSREEIMKIEDKFLEYAEKIHAEKLFRPKTSPLCKSCDHLEICEEGLRFTGKQILTYGDESW